MPKPLFCLTGASIGNARIIWGVTSARKAPGGTTNRDAPPAGAPHVSADGSRAPAEASPSADSFYFAPVVLRLNSSVRFTPMPKR